jgi:hypothetical protein
VTEIRTPWLAAEPIGYLTVLQFSDGQYDPDVDIAGLWPTPELAAAEAASPEQADRLAEGESWQVCAVIPLEERCDE